MIEVIASWSRDRLGYTELPCWSVKLAQGPCVKPTLKSSCFGRQIGFTLFSLLIWGKSLFMNIWSNFLYSCRYSLRVSLFSWNHHFELAPKRKSYQVYNIIRYSGAISFAHTWTRLCIGKNWFNYFTNRGHLSLCGLGLCIANGLLTIVFATIYLENCII